MDDRAAARSSPSAASAVADRIRKKFRQWLAATASLLMLSAFGWTAKNGYDGGFIKDVIKDVWAQVETASPGVAMMAVFAAVVIWKEWQRDREEHRNRTNEFVAAMNRAARLREREQNIYKISLEAALAARTRR